MSALRLIAWNEWRLIRRSAVARAALFMLLALSAIAAFTSIAHRDESDALRARFQARDKWVDLNTAAGVDLTRTASVSQGER